MSQAGVLSIRKSCFWIMLYLLLIQIPAPVLFKSADELCVLFLLVIMSLDMAVNRQVMRYKGSFVAVGIMAFYAIYSMTALKFNTTKAILVDFVIELKPFVPFFIGYAIAPRFTPRERQVMKIASVVITFCLLLIFITGTVHEIIYHVAFIGSTAFICFLTYIFCSVREDNTISKRDMAIAFAILAVGLCSTRSKYFGEAVFAVFMFLLYKPGAFRKIGVKQIVVAILLLLTVLAVSWQKINYYFIVGNGDTFDVDTIQSFARPALLGGMFLILCDYPLFGSGLASFATYASSPDVNYSLVYAQYDLDKVFGLSEQYYDFICDCFYAEFAQFGLVGIAIFIYFFVWIYQRLRLNLHDESRHFFAVGVLVIAYVMIENVGGTLFSQAGGLYLMLLLGVITGKYRNCDKDQRKAILQQDYK